ncbi:MAG: hypothetical protein CMH05_03495 [Marinovum sp.]|nr:hypothetical protein [Marinovum sp.]|tara:strand:+ start:4223 stop:4918 length:696 start_codon:yes stop_codon:yes gene_type:complete
MSTIKTNNLAHTANGASVYTLPQTDGSAGQVLKTDGSGNLSWVTLTDTNDYVKIDRQSNGGVASALIFDNLDVATYKFFDLMLAFVPSEDNYNTYFRFRTGGASGTDVNGNKYDYGYNETYPTDTHGGKAAGDQNEIRLSGGVGYNTNYGEGFRLNLRIMFADSSDNASSKRLSNFITWQGSRLDGSSNYRTNQGAGIYNEGLLTYPTGFKIFMGSGTLNSMSYGLYGMKR